MSDRSAIEWTDASWNPVRAMFSTPDAPKLGWHCEHASEGCRNCYAEGFNRRLGTGFDYKPGHLIRKTRLGDMRGDVSIFLDEAMLLKPLKWRKPRMVFVGSMTDLFADFVTDEMLDRIFAVMALCPQHTFQLLTKRADRMRAYVTRWYDRRFTEGPRNNEVMLGVTDAMLLAAPDIDGQALLSAASPLQRNIWIGVSVEDQAAANARIPDLLATPAAVRFLSCEPLLGPVDLRKLRHPVVGGAHVDALTGYEWSPGEIRVPMVHQNWSPDEGYYRVRWVIVGGESGPNARPMQADWARSLRDQCFYASVPFFFKQWGAWLPAGQTAAQTGLWSPSCGSPLLTTKKNAGRLLDGVEYSAMPEAAHG